MKPTQAALLLGLAALSTGCTQAYRPQFTPIDRALSQAASNPPIPTAVVIPETSKPAAGSLWQPGSKQFFKDSRASAIGDIVTVLVSEQSEATTEAETESDRAYTATSGLGNLANLEGLLRDRHIIDPVASVATNFLNTDSDRQFEGTGATERSDSISASIAAVVTQVLPNGYLVVQGSREVVVNYEMQQLQIQGIVRPEDISANNTIESAKIAEARVFYAGKGIIDEAQTPHYGVRFMEKVLPF